MASLIEQLTEEQRAEVNKEIDEILYSRKVNGTGSRVFCVSCGTFGETLYKHGNVYLCKRCKEKVEQREKEKRMT